MDVISAISVYQCRSHEKTIEKLFKQNHRILKENKLLRIELRRHSAGAMQIRSVERIIAGATAGQRHVDALVTAEAI